MLGMGGVQPGSGAPKPTFASVFRDIYCESGVRGLYRGLGPTLCRAMPANGGVFLIYELGNRFLTDVLEIEQEEQ